MALIQLTSQRTINPLEVASTFIECGYGSSRLHIIMRSGDKITVSDRDGDIYGMERKIINAANSD